MLDAGKSECHRRRYREMDQKKIRREICYKNILVYSYLSMNNFEVKSNSGEMKLDCCYHRIIKRNSWVVEAKCFIFDAYNEIKDDVQQHHHRLSKSLCRAFQGLAVLGNAPLRYLRKVCDVTLMGNLFNWTTPLWPMHWKGKKGPSSWIAAVGGM